MSAEDELQDLMLEAHANDDKAALPELYHRAAETREQAGDIDAACFFYTHAYVYALDAGNKDIATSARAALKEHGRDK